MINCFFVSDLHGKVERYSKLFAAIRDEQPAAIFLGGDLLPHGFGAESQNFSEGFLLAEFLRVRDQLGEAYPSIFILFGNDDPRIYEDVLFAGASQGAWEYIHNQKTSFRGFSIYGYACVPPTPFRLKDWERYDVSRYVDPGCISPEEGLHSVPVPAQELKYTTIAKDLVQLADQEDVSKALFLFHTPPYQTRLDRAALDGKTIDHTPLDVHVGSIAVKRFIEARQPLMTLHGHIHESARLTGSWQEKIGRTHALSAAHDGPELALVRFDLKNPGGATRELL